jgi:uncharacterized cupredoxin-like copper-binding protein
LSYLSNRIAFALAAITLSTAPAYAGPGHSAAGEPGHATDHGEHVVVVARETDDGEMIFEPSEIRVSKGTTLHLVLENKGMIEHELYIGTPEEVEEHAEQMLRFPEMEHDEPNAVRVDPGHQDVIHWQFTKEGTFTFACLLPGHMQLGMVGKITVEDPTRLGMVAPPARN